MTLGDLDIATRTIWMEARGESFEGKKAVAHVIINRMNWRPNDRWTCIAQVCLDWLQFSGWRDADPNFKKAQELTFKDSVFLECLHALVEAVREPDFTGGCRHYHAKTVLPKWARFKQPTITIGNHIFYNNID